ncbi:MAG TPA: tetratricopeptide repeat protein [Pyrinomonadaceae bacterium]|jgi:Flp pilus assembly protein TadD|nr:tetratricopeptide repeat protein [Pyrinomonadaceae bacterium]
MLERKILRPLFVALFAVSSVIAVTAQVFTPPGATDTGLGGGNALTGMILLSSGQRLQRRVSIRLQTMTKGDRVATTDEYGNFAFRGLVSGEYRVVIDKEKEFEPYSQSVEIRQFRGFPPQVYTLNIRLELKGEARVKPAVLNAELANVPKPALVHYNNAAEQARKNDHPAAIEELKLAIKEYPAFMLAFNELGVQYLKLNQLENADEAFQGALKIDPDAFGPLMNRGIANFMMKRYGEAVPILRKAVKKNDQSAVAHYFLGQALANLGLFEDAEKELVASLTLGNEDIKEAHRLLAIIYISRGAKKLAAEQLEAYLKVAPDTPDAENLREKIRQLRESNE